MWYSTAQNDDIEGVNATTWYHGGACGFENLIKGKGVAGDGLYLTKNRKRAEMYAKKDNAGKLRENPCVYEVRVRIEPAKIFYGSKMYNLAEWVDKINSKQFTEWVQNTVAKYGEQSVIMDGQNANIVLSGRNNEKMIELGYDAFTENDDLILLNIDKIINLSKKSI